MDDYLNVLEQFKQFKEIADLVDEVKKLREYYYTQKYDKMHQHINELTVKYFIETFAWNTIHPNMPATVQQAYLNAEIFLRLKGYSLLLEKGVKLQEKLSAEGEAFVESMIEPKE